MKHFRLLKALIFILCVATLEITAKAAGTERMQLAFPGVKDLAGLLAVDVAVMSTT